MTWRKLVTYPQCMLPSVCKELDILETLVPVPDSGDRYIDIADWLNNAVNVGLLTPAERFKIRAEIGPNL